jgi:Cu(I)/Ag(I) efflux system membrane fusion protein
VALGGGRFKPVPVRTGIETGGKVEILGGLKEGEEVVVSAQFLIDSESNLQASFRRMTAH